jgi:hypothetical protein
VGWRLACEGDRSDRFRRSSARLLALFVVAAGFAVPAAHAGASTAHHPDVTPPPPEQSPFSGADDFCTPITPAAGTSLGASMPGVTPTTVEVALVVPTTAAADVASHLAELANSCGGIQGRRLALHPVVTSGDPVADCASLVTTGASVVAVSAPVVLDDCVRANPGLVMIAPSAAAPNEVLATTHGRLFVGDSTEGALDARIEDLVDHADLGSKPFAVVTGSSDQSQAFAASLARVLTAHGLHPALDLPPDALDAVRQLRRARVGTVLTDAVYPDLVRGLAARADPPTTFVMSGSPPKPSGPKTMFDAPAGGSGGGTPGVQSWMDPRAAATTAGLAPSKLPERCAQWATLAVGRARATTVPPTTVVPAGSDETLTAACLATRLLARGLFMAGPNPTERDVVRAFHNLPNTDRTGPDGQPAARPNQLVNEPVRRVQTVVVRTQLTTSCPAPGSTTTSPSSTAQWCWVPVNGYGDGGRAVDTDLTTSTLAG